MSEASRFWNTTNIGDGPATGYSGAAIGEWAAAVFGRNASGILVRVLNELAVSGTASPLTVATGAALVDGKFYVNDAALTLAVSSPGVGTTGGRVVLEANWAAQTVRAKVVKNTDGNSSPPALTQTPGSVYQISLATFTITTGGVIGALVNATGRASFANSPRAETLGMPARTVLGNSTGAARTGEALAAASDGQALRRSGSSLGFGQIAAAGLANDAVTADKLSGSLELATAQFANGAVTNSKLADNAVDDAKAGDRIPALIRRQGGDGTDWNLPGTMVFTPGRVTMLCGVIYVTISSGFGAYADVTLPVALSKPLLYTSIVYQSSAIVPREYTSYAVAISNSVIRVFGKRNSSWIESVQVDVAWLAIGVQV